MAACSFGMRRLGYSRGYSSPPIVGRRAASSSGETVRRGESGGDQQVGGLESQHRRHFAYQVGTRLGAAHHRVGARHPSDLGPRYASSRRRHSAKAVMA